MNEKLKALLVSVVATLAALQDYLNFIIPKDDPLDDMLGGGTGGPPKPGPTPGKPAPTPAKKPAPTPAPAKPAPQVPPKKPAPTPAPAKPAPAPAKGAPAPGLDKVAEKKAAELATALDELGAADLRLLLRYMNNKVRETVSPKSLIAQMKSDAIKQALAKYSADSVTDALTKYKEAPAEEPAPAVEEAPAEEAPVEEAPAEEAPVEEAPAEEPAPAEESTEGDTQSAPADMTETDMLASARNAAIKFANKHGRDKLREALNKYTKGAVADVPKDKLPALIKDLSV